MLGMGSYGRRYIDVVRERVAADVAAYKRFIADAKKNAGAKKMDTAIASFEPAFFNNMVIALDGYFVHRLRTKEGKDGNPLNEVRVLCTSLMNNDGKLAADKNIKLKPEASVLKLEVGDVIRLSEKDFSRLSAAFFTEVEKKFA